MNSNSVCIACLAGKQEKQIAKFNDEAKKNEYMQKVHNLLEKYGYTESSPWLAEKLEELYVDFWKEKEDFTEIKHRYNQLLLSKEAGLEEKIKNADDPIKECIKYVCAANYIDFSAVENVNESTFESLLKKAGEEKVSDTELSFFKKDLSNAKKLVYMTDNCGEVLIDKIFIKFLMKENPKLSVTAIVRGKNVINDATLEDAEEVGLTDIIPCIGNGNAAPGSVLSRFTKEALDTLRAADMVIAKGQGNFEGLYGEGINPYFLFLCKCTLFQTRFGLKQYSSVFSKEERIKAVNEVK